MKKNHYSRKICFLLPPAEAILKNCFIWLLLLVTTGAAQAQTFSGIGNTWIGGAYTTKRGDVAARHVNGKINEGYVTAQGELYGVSIYDEAHQEVARYWDNGDGRAAVERIGPNSWPMKRIAVTVNDKYVFTNLAGNIITYDVFNSATVKQITLNTLILGMAWANGELYVSDNSNNLIKVYTEDLEFKREFAVDRPRKLTVAPDGNLWVIRGGTDAIFPAAGATVVKVDKNTGAVLHTISDVIWPSSIATSHANGNLLIADSDADRNNIRIYNPADGSFTGQTFGVSISNAANPGSYTDATQFDYLTAIGQAANGDYVVASLGSIDIKAGGEGGVLVRRVTPAGEKVWEGMSNPFIDAADLDPADHTIAYTSIRKMKIDYNAPADRRFQALGSTIDRKNYPDDPRLHNTLINFSQAFRRDGKLFTVVTNQWNGFYCVYREGAGTIMVPSIKIENDRLWIDGHGGNPFDGRMQPGEFQELNSPNKERGFIWFDKGGNIWVTYGIYQPTSSYTKFRRYACKGLTANGIPSYDITDFKEYDNPDFDKVQFAQYDADADVLFVSGFNKGDNNREWSWRTPGRRLKRYDNFLGGNHAAFEERSTMEFPALIVPEHHIISWSVSGDYVFAGQRKEDEYHRNTILLYDSKTGALFDKWNMPNTIGGGADGSWWPGTGYDAPHAVRSVKKDDGSYVVMAEDVSFSKVIFITWTPPAMAEDQVKLISPDRTIIAGQSTRIHASVNDTDGNVKKMEFSVDGQVVYTAESLPFIYTWTPTKAETITLKAQPLDASGNPIGISGQITLTSTALPDLIVTDISISPANPTAGTAVTISATVKNIGEGPTREGMIIGGVFFVNGGTVNWTDNYSKSLAPGGSAVVTATNGPSAVSTWNAVAGIQNISFLVDDVNRIIETNENNNTFGKSFCIGTADGAPIIRFNKPRNNAEVSFGIDNEVDITATDCDGSIAKVELFEDGVKVGESTAAPYVFKYKPGKLGAIKLSVKATDNEGKASMAEIQVTSAATTRYEAENGKVTNARIVTKSGASGGRAVGYIDFDDSSVELDVFVPEAGSYTLKVGYSNGMGSPSSHLLFINGGSPLTLKYPPTPNWDVYGSITVTAGLQAGNNKLVVKRGVQYAELDYIAVSPADDNELQLEAENAKVNRVNIVTKSGASGGKAVGGIDFEDSFVEFNFEVPQAGEFTLKVGYSNSMGSPSSHLFSVNGGEAVEIEYPATPSWDTYQSVSATVNLQAGANKIVVRKGRQFAELDYISLIALPQKVYAYEAENAEINRANVNTKPSASGGKVVGGIDFEESSVKFTVEVPKKGMYQLTADYANGMGNLSSHLIFVNGATEPVEVEYLSNGSWEVIQTARVLVALQEGANTITFKKGQSFAELDVIKLVLVPDETAPSIPGNVKATAAPYSVALTWDASTDNVGVAGYEVYQDGVKVATVTGTSHTAAHLAASQGYTFTVKAFDATGNVSGASQPVAVSTPAPASVRYEAEKASLSGAMVFSNQSGFSGTGFVKFPSNSGNYAEWTVTSAYAGEHILKFRYANGQPQEQDFRLTVNGTVTNSSLLFDYTGAWSSWRTITVKVSLPAGSNKIRLTTTGAKNSTLDYLEVTDPLEPVFSTGAVARVSQAAKRETTVQPVAAYPNPFGTKLTLTLGGAMAGKQQIALYDARGMVVYQMEWDLGGERKLELDLAGAALKPGVYLLKMVDQNGNAAVIRLGKQ